MTHLLSYDMVKTKTKVIALLKGVLTMKGYHTESGYMGYVDGHYELFASEADYREWVED